MKLFYYSVKKKKMVAFSSLTKQRRRYIISEWIGEAAKSPHEFNLQRRSEMRDPIFADGNRLLSMASAPRTASPMSTTMEWPEQSRPMREKTDWKKKKKHKPINQNRRRYEDNIDNDNMI